MIEHVLSFLKEQLNSYIRVKTGAQGFEVVFLQERNQKEVSFHNDAITTLLVNLEEDYTFRSGAAIERMPNQGSKGASNPNIYLNLYVLFTANFADYQQSLQFLSLIIKFFQSHRLFNHQNSPALYSEIEKLTLELVNLSFAEQREVWAALGMSYMPSVIYKVRMVIFTDADTIETDSDVTGTEVMTVNI
jgi:Pvc16 N-terminal domain